ncbi:putative palmitoyl-protein thioesterase 1 protein [Phaeoacremonium minimum UCRPA7]|uniref:Palmitoyl-protein thioesterase 1 n=1 Tax=Phaeoacremonium minimum (strain UCR-PA7) TaxID=1286976 RepID=R8BNT5_PHAM7|nr:putative palmitoyl-protein thioesterase 1 protein [Phaeoacremonium minimum UCRPA7]EOO01063.1 putative palmitoyl-protein thioesterase 1 protein [Phaeoacremonium minimum UCRPA7]
MMALARHLKFLLTFGSLVSAFALPSLQKTLDDDEDNDDTPLPLVIWHGLGDNYAAAGLREVGELAEAINPGTLVYYIRMDENASRDRSATFLGNVTQQIEKVCSDLAAHPILSTAPAIDALGFSQGGQFLRGYVQRCNNPPIRSLVTFGSQHNGISSFRDCPFNDWVCKGAMALLKYNTWSGFVQNRLVPAQYYRDPLEYDQYLENSNFLADINNERVLKNVTYKENLAKLVNLVLYMFEEDTTVIPKETAWFEEVNGTEITPLRARKLYSEDWLGLRELDRKGGLKFRTTPGDHMQLSEKTLNDTFKEFFGPLKKTFSPEPTQLGPEEL